MSGPEPEKSVDQKNKGDECFHEGDYKGAIRFYLSSLQIDPKYISAWNNLGLAFLKSGHSEEAARCKERRERLKSLQGVVPTRGEPTIPDGTSLDEAETLRLIESLLQESKDETIPGVESPQDGSTGMPPSPPPILDLPADDAAAIPAEKAKSAGLFEWMKSEKSNGDLFVPGSPSTNQQTIRGADLKRMIALSFFIGIVIFFSLFIMEGGEQQYTQFYLVPESVQTFNSETNSGTFIYGVKSFEKDPTFYELTVYAENELLDKKTFTLTPGQKIEEMVSFQLKDPGFNQTQVKLFLKSSNSTYTLHYWIKK